MFVDNLEIFLASPRGHCAGVIRAIDIVQGVLDMLKDVPADLRPKVYVYHEIVHNVAVIKYFSDNGVIFTEDLSIVDDGSIVIFSAHGVSEKLENTARESGFFVVNACCPLVTKVHKEAIKYESLGYEILFIGHKGHPEVVGTCGRIKGTVKLIENVNDAEKVCVSDVKKVCYITQTTLSVYDTKKIIDVLTSRFPDIRGPSIKDICYATQNRQMAAAKVAQLVDLMLVIGSKNSSNSNRLRDICNNDFNVTSYLIDSYHDISSEWFTGVKRVGITSGASAPEFLVNELVDYLKSVSSGSYVADEIVVVDEDVKFNMPKEIYNLRDALLGLREGTCS